MSHVTCHRPSFTLSWLSCCPSLCPVTQPRLASPLLRSLPSPPQTCLHVSNFVKLLLKCGGANQQSLLARVFSTNPRSAVHLEVAGPHRWTESPGFEHPLDALTLVGCCSMPPRWRTRRDMHDVFFDHLLSEMTGLAGLRFFPDAGRRPTGGSSSVITGS